jgi:anti-sigma regulatory factor (Ser/Thr protein kinase)
MMPAVDELGCGRVLAWPLPQDRTCAGIARALAGEVLSRLRMPPEMIGETQIMISELATNACEHARPPLGEDRGVHELWMYRLGHRIVCGVFDPVPERPLHRDGTPSPESGGMAERGRGLGIVHAYSLGWWGAHRTRGQLGDHVPGKVVWFACQAEIRTVSGPERLVARGDAAAMGRLLRDRLLSRRIGGTILRMLPGIAVLSVCRGLNVWCHDGRYHLHDKVPAETMARPGEELAAVVEHVVRRYEELHGEDARARAEAISPAAAVNPTAL